MSISRLPPELRAAIRDAVNSALVDYRKKGDIELQRSVSSGAVRDERLIMRSPDGQRWVITVSNGGTLSAVPL